MAEEKERKEPGIVRYKLGRLRERGFGRLLCLLGRHRYRDEGVNICMRCLRLEAEGGTRRRGRPLGRALATVGVGVVVFLWLFSGWLPSPLQPMGVVLAYRLEPGFSNYSVTMMQFREANISGPSGSLPVSMRAECNGDLSMKVDERQLDNLTVEVRERMHSCRARFQLVNFTWENETRVSPLSSANSTLGFKMRSDGEVLEMTFGNDSVPDLASARLRISSGPLGTRFPPSRVTQGQDWDFNFSEPIVLSLDLDNTSVRFNFQMDSTLHGRWNGSDTISTPAGDFYARRIQESDEGSFRGRFDAESRDQKVPLKFGFNISATFRTTRENWVDSGNGKLVRGKTRTVVNLTNFSTLDIVKAIASSTLGTPRSTKSELDLPSPTPFRSIAESGGADYAAGRATGKGVQSPPLLGNRTSDYDALFFTIGVMDALTRAEQVSETTLELVP